jgi:NitT/TauT family transport system ATP-binding protein
MTAVFQEDRLIEHWDAIKNIKLVCDKTVTTEQIRQELKKVGIEDSQNQPVRSFSGGMRRRVALIRAMIAKFDILLLDEPFKGLDEALKKRVAEYVKQKTAGKTVIVVTHEKAEAELLGAKLVTLL